MAEKIKSHWVEDLVQEGLLTAEQLKKAQAEESRTGEPLYKVLIRLGYLSEKVCLNFLAGKSCVPFVDLESYIIDPSIIELVPESLARKHHLIPLFKIKDVLTAAVADPFDLFALDEIRHKTGLKVEIVLSAESDIEKAILHHYGTSRSVDEIVTKLQQEVGQLDLSGETPSELKIKALADEAPMIKLVDYILLQAIKDGASDVHIEPADKEIIVRFRIDGILHRIYSFSKNIQAPLISRIKIMSKMDISEARLPQDGRFEVRLQDHHIDVRAATFPTIYGENLNLRLLDSASMFYSLEQLGMNEITRKSFEAQLQKPYGIMLVTGPTGSGKTTTLYGALDKINSPTRNIITIEDPVEYNLAGVRQSQVNLKAGLTFSVSLRSILRQDPDVIMVGEIRDLETARLAIQSALTGHLILSTLHTNNAVGALTRLTDMGIEPYLVSSTVVAVLAQRLVRTICPHCRTSYQPTPELLNSLGIFDANVIFYQGTGCQNCRQTGYLGRTGIFELVTLNDDIRNLVMSKSPTTALRKAAVEAGQPTLLEDGLKKVLSGATTLAEVLRVSQQE